MQLTSSSNVSSGVLSAASRRLFHLCLLIVLTVAGSIPMWAQGGEEELKLPDLHTATFLDGAVTGPTLLLIGLGVSVLGFVFGLMMYMHQKNLPVHESMREVSELIYETCKT